MAIRWTLECGVQESERTVAYELFFLFQTCSAALGTYLSCFIRTLATQKYCSSTIDILCFATQK